MVKKLFYINSEMEPFASVSNQGNLSVDIPLGLQQKENDVRCLMPKDGFISERKYILREVIRLKEILFEYEDVSAKCSPNGGRPNTMMSPRTPNLSCFQKWG